MYINYSGGKYFHIYIYIYIEREREREGKSKHKPLKYSIWNTFGCGAPPKPILNPPIRLLEREPGCGHRGFPVEENGMFTLTIYL